MTNLKRSFHNVWIKSKFPPRVYILSTAGRTNARRDTAEPVATADPDEPAPPCETFSTHLHSFQPVVQFLMLFVVIAIFHTFKTLLSRSGNVWTGRPGSSARGLVSEVAWGWRNQKTVSCCLSCCYCCLPLLLFLFLLRCVLAIWFKKPEYSNKEMNFMWSKKGI